MQYEVDYIPPALFSEIDEQKERVEELFPDDNTIDVLKGLIELKQEKESISPEDLAWADSCLVNDPELSMGSWISLREALLDSIAAFATSNEENNAAGVEEDDQHTELDGEQEIINGGDHTAQIPPAGLYEEEPVNGNHMELGEEQEIVKDRGDNTNHIQRVGFDGEVGKDKHLELGEEQEIINGRGNADHIQAKVNNNGGVHDSIVDEDDGEAEIVDTEKGFDSRESIFKVWELRKEDEDDEIIYKLQRAFSDLRVVEKGDDWFIADLNRAVAESIIIERRRLTADEADAADDKKLDELISSMGGLSIKSFSL